jgi:hypothetical protein
LTPMPRRLERELALRAPVSSDLDEAVWPPGTEASGVRVRVTVRVRVRVKVRVQVRVRVRARVRSGCLARKHQVAPCRP